VGRFILNPLFGADFSTVGNRLQKDLLSNGHRPDSLENVSAGHQPKTAASVVVGPACMPVRRENSLRSVHPEHCSTRNMPVSAGSENDGGFSGSKVDADAGTHPISVAQGFSIAKIKMRHDVSPVRKEGYPGSSA
jgi:hypothetical protein